MIQTLDDPGRLVSYELVDQKLGHQVGRASDYLSLCVDLERERAFVGANESVIHMSDCTLPTKRNGVADVTTRTQERAVGDAILSPLVVELIKGVQEGLAGRQIYEKAKLAWISG